MSSGSWRLFYAEQMASMAQELIDKADRTRLAGIRNRNAGYAYRTAENYEKEALDLRKAAGYLRRRQSEEIG